MEPTKKGIRIIERMLGIDKLAEQGERWQAREDERLLSMFGFVSESMGKRLKLSRARCTDVFVPPPGLEPLSNYPVTIVDEPVK